MVDNPHYEGGLSTSLRLGAQEVLGLGPSAGTMVLLADQPAFSVAQARSLIQVFRERRADTVAVAAAEGGEQRNPVVFRHDLLSELLEVRGDRGARGVLRRYENRVEKLELNPGPWSVDADDWATYAALMRECGWLEEVTLPEFTGEVSAELAERIEQALRRDPVPRLAPDVLLVAIQHSQFERGVRLEPNLQSHVESGIRSVIIGDASPEAYLNLLRRAALWALQR